MININLLPEELTPDKKYLNISKKIIKGLIVWLVLLIIGAGTAFFYTYTLKQKINDSLENQDQLKTSIKALQETEQRLILIKDRLDKISQITAIDSSWGDIGNVEEMVRGFSDEINYQSSIVDPGEVEMRVLVTDSIMLGQYLDQLLEESEYGSITLKTLEFDKRHGYEVNLDFVD